MDNTQLAKWKREMEMQLAEVEKQLTGIEKERAALKAKLGAVTTLLSPAEEITAIENYEARDLIGAFIADLKVNGWSVGKHGGKIRSYDANRGGQSVELWIIFSKLHEVSERYWFGVNPDHLENRNGGVILLLGTHKKYICLPFTKLQEILEGSKNTRAGHKLFHVRQKSGQVELQPAGIGGKWINVTAYLNGEGLKRIGIN